MAALEALRFYGSESSSDSEGEDISVPDISSQNGQQEVIEPREQELGKDLKPELPLPSEILSLFGNSSSKEQSEPSLHQGKIRSFAHVPGNWATFVYIPAECSSLANLVETLMACLPSDVTFNPSDDLHLSLSRTVCLQFHWIEIFRESLMERFCGMRSFLCHVEQVEVYTNDEKTRTFVGLRVGAGHESLCELVKLTDECLSEFALPVFYKNPSFHVSFCWCVGDVSSRIKSTFLQPLQEKLHLFPSDLTINVTEVHCKTGCKKFVFPLR